MIQERANLKERAIHGSADFPLCVYRSRPNQDESILFCHWHDEVEIMYLASGSATFYLDTVPVEIGEGEAVIINSGTIHSGASADFQNCVFYAVVFDFSMLFNNKAGDSLGKYLVPVHKGQYRLPVKLSREGEQDREILQQVRNIVDAYINRKPAYPLTILSSLYAILGGLIAQDRLTAVGIVKTEASHSRLAQFKAVLAFIEENYSQKIGIREMADHINMSPYHFCRFFKTMSGKTPFEYLIGYRIHQAELLLKDPSRKIIDIALEVGFNNISYFIKSFREYKKMTPAKYRSGEIGSETK
jgi:AraC-like DNA-binding protein